VTAPRAAFDALSAAHEAHRGLPAARRRVLMLALTRTLARRTDDVLRAVDADFGGRCAHGTRVADGVGERAADRPGVARRPVRIGRSPVPRVAPGSGLARIAWRKPASGIGGRGPDGHSPPMSERIATRIRHPGPFAPGDRVRLEPERAHHLRHVLRLPEGATVALFDADHGEWAATVETYGKRDATLAVRDRRRAPEAPSDGLHLLLPPIQRDRLEATVEKATELGVGRIVPVFTARTQGARTQGGRVNVDRLAAIATAAAEQCERLDVPPVAAPVALDALLRDWPTGRTLVVATEAGAARPVAEVAAAVRGGPVSLMAGPEGGFASTELDALRNLPFCLPVGLGPRVLRADTAAVALVACWQSLAGDWTAGGTDRRPPFRG
jgi:16S rRNA (uracil1498-N3)-methyltransferase